MNDAAFDGTPGLRDELEQEVGPATAGALLGAIEQQQVLGALLLFFLAPLLFAPLLASIRLAPGATARPRAMAYDATLALIVVSPTCE